MGTPAPVVRVALVQDDAEVRAGLEALLGTALNCRCVAAFATAEEALGQLPALQPGIVLTTLSLLILARLAHLRAIANAGVVMPPKSNWFEPKLRDAMFCHMLGA